MAIAYVSMGAVATGTTSVAPAAPASLASTDGVLILVVTKPDTAAIVTPTGWTLIANVAGGGGTVGNGTGPTQQAWFFREYDGVWTMPTITVTNGSRTAAAAFRFTRGAGSWDVAGASGVYGTSAVTTSGTTILGSNPGLTAGDQVIGAWTTQTTTSSTGSGEAFSATGVSAWGTVTERADQTIGASTNPGVGSVVVTGSVTTGTATAAPTMTATFATTTRGTAAMVRLREGAVIKSASDTAAISVSESSTTATPKWTQTFESGTNNAGPDATNSAGGGQPVTSFGTVYSNTAPYGTTGALRGNMSAAFGNASGAITMSVPVSIPSSTGPGVQGQSQLSFYFYIPTLATNNNVLIASYNTGTSPEVRINASSQTITMHNASGTQQNTQAFSRDTLYRMVIKTSHTSGANGRMDMWLYDDTGALVLTNGFTGTTNVTGNVVNQFVLEGGTTGIASLGAYVDEMTFADGFGDVAFIQGITQKSASDTCAISVSESTSSTSTISASDTSAISVTEFKQINFPPSDNMLLNSNPGGETGSVTPWTNPTSNATLSIVPGSYSDQNPSGRNYIKVVCNTAGTVTVRSGLVPINAWKNGANTGIMNRGSDLKASVAKSVNFGYQMYDGSQSAQISGSSPVSVTTSWQRFTASNTLVSATNSTQFISLHYSATMAVGEELYIDAAYFASSPNNTSITRTDPLDQNEYVALSVSDIASITKQVNVSVSDTAAISISTENGYVDYSTYTHLSETFESGSHTFDSVNTNAGGTAVVSNLAGHSSTYGARVHSNNTSGSYAYFRKDIPESQYGTIKMWFKVNSFTNSIAPLFSLYNVNLPRVWLYVDSGGFLSASDGVQEEALSGVSISTGTWYRLEFNIYDDGSAAAYVNGVQHYFGSLFGTDLYGPGLGQYYHTRVNVGYEPNTYSSAAVGADVDFDDIVIMSEQVPIVTVPTSVSDAAAISASESSVVQRASTSTEAPAVSVSDVSSVVVTLSRTDACAVSVEDSSSLSINNSLPGVDTAAITISDIASISATATTTDTTAVSVSDVSASALTLSRTDTTAVSAVDVSSPLVLLSRTDACAISVSDVSSPSLTISTTDTSAISVSDVSSITIVTALSTTDTSAISVAEARALDGSSTSSDTTAVSVVDVSTHSSTLSTTDTSAVSVSDVSALAGSSTSTDTCAISVSDVSSIVVSHTRTDAAAVSVAETSNVAVTQPTTDTTAVSVVESNTLAGSSTSTDTSAVSVSDVASIAVTQTTTDTSAISVAETSSIDGTVTAVDAAAVSVADVSNPSIAAPGQENTAISVTESVTLAVSFTTTDTTAVSVADSSSVAVTQFVSTADTSAISVVETINVQKPITASDTAAVSVVESRLIDSATSVNDNTNISVVDNTTQSLTFASTDTSALSVDDNYDGMLITLTADDAVSISVVESYTKFLSDDDTDDIAISVDEVVDIVKTDHATQGYVFISGEWVPGEFYAYVDGGWRHTLAYSNEAIGWT